MRCQQPDLLACHCVLLHLARPYLATIGAAVAGFYRVGSVKFFYQSGQTLGNVLEGLFEAMEPVLPPSGFLVAWEQVMSVPGRKEVPGRVVSVSGEGCVCSWR